MILAVTGHRPDKLGGYSSLAMRRLDLFAEVILRHWTIENTIEKVITGMALGWDQSVARVCVALDIPFLAAIPFAGQERLWPDASKQVYNTLLRQAIEVVTVCEGSYTSHKMQKRNEWMVDHADVLLALWNGTTGGTRNCVHYAERKQVEVVRLWDDWQKFLVAYEA